jgi:ADP-heptose:LPS heptosyltransferase
MRKNILIIRLGGIGDLAFTLPLLYRLKDEGYKITFLSESKYAPLLSVFPVDKVLAFNPGKISLIKLMFKLLSTQYDVVLDLQNDKRTGNLRGIINTGIYKSFPRIYIKHMVDMFLDISGLELKPPLNVLRLPPDLMYNARKWLDSKDITKPFIIIQPFTSCTLKNWDLINYIEYARYWADRGYQIVFGGGPGDIEKLKDINYPVAAGENILTSLGIASLSSLVVGGDTGLLHLAVATGVKALMLMIATKPENFGPYQHPELALCNPNISTVIDETMKLLNDKGKTL